MTEHAIALAGEAIVDQALEVRLGFRRDIGRGARQASAWLSQEIDQPGIWILRELLRGQAIGRQGLTCAWRIGLELLGARGSVCHHPLGRSFRIDPLLELADRFSRQGCAVLDRRRQHGAANTPEHSATGRTGQTALQIFALAGATERTPQSTGLAGASCSNREVAAGTHLTDAWDQQRATELAERRCGRVLLLCELGAPTFLGDG